MGEEYDHEKAQEAAAAEYLEEYLEAVSEYLANGGKVPHLSQDIERRKRNARIKELRRAGVPLRTIAEMLGISHQRVWEISRRTDTNGTK